MSYIVNTSVAPFCHNQNHAGSVPVPTVCMPTVVAQESSFTESESLLGSREATRTRHRRVRGPHHHHRSASPLATLDQFPLGRPDRRVRSFPRHRRLRQELRREILHRNQIMVLDNRFRPHPGIMRILAGRFLLQPRRITRSAGITRRLRTTLTAVTPRHLPLRLGKFGSTTLPVPQVRKIKDGIRGGCRCSHTPVDPDRTVHRRSRLRSAANNEGCIPVSQRILRHPNRCRIAGKLPRPHHRESDAFRQDQLPLLDRETTNGVFERRPRILPRLDGRTAAALHRERVIERRRVGAQGLLLSDLRPVSKPH